jgi:DNA-binding LytR/AlgR family response regulator
LYKATSCGNTIFNCELSGDALFIGYQEGFCPNTSVKAGGATPGKHKYESIENRFDRTVSILLKQTAGSADLTDISLDALGLATGRSARIAIKAIGKIVFIDSAEIIALEADGNRTFLRHTSGSYLIREPISTMAAKLNPYGFVRVHRSVLVNIAHVQELRRCDTGAYLLRVSGGKEYPIARTYKENLKFLAASWLGTEI